MAGCKPRQKRQTDHLAQLSIPLFHMMFETETGGASFLPAVWSTVHHCTAHVAHTGRTTNGRTDGRVQVECLNFVSVFHSRTTKEREWSVAFMHRKREREKDRVQQGNMQIIRRRLCYPSFQKEPFAHSSTAYRVGRKSALGCVNPAS